MSMIDPRGQGGSGGGGFGHRWCALCGAEYVPGVVECSTCLVPLVDQPPLRPDDIGDDAEEQLAYDFDDLDTSSRLVIDRELASRGIVHAWDGATLLVAPYDEAEVDAILEGTEHDGELGSDVGDGEQLVYDLSDWDAEQRAELAGRLQAVGVDHAFDEHGDLVVADEEEERVDEIVDAVEFPDQLPADDGDTAGGLDAIEAVGAVFVAADRLAHDPADSDAVLAAADGSRAIDAMPPPFGFAPPVWEELVDRARELRRLLETEAEVVDDDAVVEAATRLRSALRPYV